MSTAIVIGSEGQDGRIVTERLTREGVRVVGIGRDVIHDSADLESRPVDITDPRSAIDLVQRCRPDEIYYLAAIHGSSESQTNDEPAELEAMLAVHVRGIANVLTAVSDAALDSRVVYASSSRIFGTPPTETQTEETPLAPECLYGITKAAGMLVCRRYRQERGTAVSAAIFYNHESSLRGPSYVSQRIIQGVVAIANGTSDELVVGDLDAEADWGWAPDYVDALVRIARHDSAGEFIVASGRTNSIRRFVEVAFSCAGLDWRDHVREDPSLIGRRRPRMIGDSTKLTEATGWRPSLTFNEMVRQLWSTAAARAAT